MNAEAQTGPPWSVAVVDNHEAIRMGVMAYLLTRADAFGPCTAFADLESLTAAPATPDLIVLDLYLGRDDTPSVHAIPALRTHGSAVVLYTSEERPAPLRRALAAGISGLVLKNDTLTALAAALEAAARGEFTCSSVLAEALLNDETLTAALTPREAQVLSCIDEGLTAKQVASRLDIQQSTVRTHLKAVRAKYMDLGREVTNTMSLIAAADREGWIDPRT